MNLWQDEPAWLRRAADPRVFAVACVWLFILVVLGTLAQRDLGLFQAQERYFNAWLLWIGPVPLPGGRLALTLTGLNLLAVLFTRRGTRNPGLFLLHAGTLLLLGGALVGSALRQEGSLALHEGEIRDAMDSWRHHELRLIVDAPGRDRMVSIGEALLAPGAAITHPEVPVGLTVAEHHANTASGAATLTAAPPEPEAERNVAGLVLVRPDGTRLALREHEAPAAVAPGVTACLRRIATDLPVAIELLQFTRDDHPGTAMARGFSSEVMVHEAGGSRRVVIAMNRPLRIGSWTFYQQSYGESANGPFSVLAVVHDRFQLSPYIASGIMLLGLLLHLVLRLVRREAA